MTKKELRQLSDLLCQFHSEEYGYSQSAESIDVVSVIDLITEAIDAIKQE